MNVRRNVKTTQRLTYRKKNLVLKNALVKMHDLCIIFLNKQGYMYTKKVFWNEVAI